MYLTSRHVDEEEPNKEKAEDVVQASTSIPARSWLSDRAYYYRGAIAGAAAGCAMLLGPQDRESKKTVALFLFARALVQSM